MAGSKETTRQKMINLMYLVFIAMLALNISKEVLGTLGILKEDISKATEETEAQINFAYTKIESNSDNQRYAATLEEKDNLQSATNDFYNFLQDIKDMLEKDDEGNIDESLRKTIDIEGEEVTIWDYQLMTKGKELQDYFFLKPTIPVKDGIRLDANENGAKFIELYSSFEKNVSQVLDSINAKNERYGVAPFDFAPIKADLKTRFPFSDDGTVVDRDGDKQPYLRYHFDGFPLIASISKIANMQSNIRAVESRILVAILGGIAVDEGDVGKNYRTNLYSDRSAFYTNSIVDAKIVLGRNDDNFQPTDVDLSVDGVKLNEDEYLIEDGGVKLNRSWYAAKTYNLTGTLFFNQDGEEKEVEVDQKFTVINPPDKPVIAPVQMQVFYVGLNNEIEVAFPGTDETTISVGTLQGEIKRENGKLLVNPNEDIIGKENIREENENAIMGITVSAQGDEGLVSRTLNFRVRATPPGTGSIINTAGGVTTAYTVKNDKITQGAAIYGTLQGEKPAGMLYNYSISITKFEVTVGNLVTKTVNGNKIVNNPAAQADVESAGPGTPVKFRILEATKQDGDVISSTEVDPFTLFIN